MSIDVNAEKEIEAQKDGPPDQVDEGFGRDVSDDQFFAISFGIV